MGKLSQADGKVAAAAVSSWAHRPVSKRLWGRAADLEWIVRTASIVFAVASIASMSFAQLGFWSIGIVDGKPVYLMLILAPLAMGALVFGPLMGGLLGLFAGAVLYVHAQVFPLDYYELYFMSPLNTFALLTFLGAAAGVMFSRVLPAGSKGLARFGRVVAVGAVLSFLASGFIVVNTLIVYGGVNSIDDVREYLFISPLGVVVQAVLDAVLVIAMCWMADYSLCASASRTKERTLLSMFRNMLLFVSLIVFMVTSAIIFSAATFNAQREAEEAMVSEVNYLQRQMELRRDADPASLLEGYTYESDGTVVITDEAGKILATDDEAHPVGQSFSDLVGYSEAELVGYDETNILEIVAENGGFSALQAVGDDGHSTLEFAFLAVAKCDGGYAAMLRTSEMVYVDRFGVMAATAMLAIVLISAIGILATLLLNQVVVRRIDETNGSLEKITAGDLSVRVNVRDSREFASLSSGINTTVSALKDTIDEVEQRNARELATAKAIQESALPRAFPPFPDIDRFDLYASMKTAKEVGGDFYDFFLIEEDKLGFVIADVSGKGIPAALFMMTAKTQIRNYMEAGLPVGESIEAANHQLCIGNDAGMFVTVFACMLDYRTGSLSYVNAGHNPPLLHADGSWEWMRDVSGMPLGLFEGLPYESYSRTLGEGDALYLYTDGVTEAMDSAGELFGEDRLVDTLRVYESMNSRSICVGMRRALTDFTLDAEQSDDITMLCLKYGVPPEKKAVMILPAVDTQLVHMYNFVHEELRRRNAPKSVYNPLDIAAEELFVNVCHYAYPDATPENPGEVRIAFEYEANPPSLTVEIADDGIPYDPLAKPDAVTPDNIADVPIGGLGILMAKRSVDEMSYRRENGSNILTFKKGW